VGRHRDLDLARLAVALAAQPDVLENKSGEMLNGVQNGLNLQLNSWSPGRVLAFLIHSQATRTVGDQLFDFTTLDAIAPSMGGGGERRRRLPNSSSRRRRSPRVTDSPAPAHRRARDVGKNLQAVKTKPCKKTEISQNHPQILLQTQK
jgi:hypothetical protein